MKRAMMKAGAGGPLLPRRLRALRRSVLFRVSQLPQQLFRLLALVIALGLVMWKRYRAALFTGVILVLCTVGTVSHSLYGGLMVGSPSGMSLGLGRERRSTIEVNTVAGDGMNQQRAHNNDPRRMLPSLPSLITRKPRELTTAIELVSDGVLTSCRFSEVCVDGNIHFGLKLHFPEVLTHRRDLLRRCGLTMDHDFSVRAAMDTLHAKDLIGVSNDSQKQRVAIERLYKNVYENADPLAYECYAKNDDELCEHPAGKEVQLHAIFQKSSLQSGKVPEDLEINEHGDLHRSCFRSLVSLCKVNESTEIDAPACGTIEHSELHLLDLKSLLSIADSALARLHQLSEEKIGEDSVSLELPETKEPIDEFIEVYRNSKNVVVACRLGPACRDSGGMFILPKWMREKEHLFEDFGLKNRVGFGLPVDTLATSDVDLFGLETPHAFPGRFLGGFLGAVTALDTLLGSGRRNKSISMNCYHEKGSEQCKEENAVTSPQIMLHDAVKGGYRKSWIENFVQTLPPDPSGPRILYTSTVNQAQRVCFRSIVGGRESSRNFTEFLNNDTALFRKLNVSRTAILGSPRESCNVRVTILDYRDDKAVPYNVRPITNAKHLKNAIRFKSRSHFFSQFSSLVASVTIINPQQRHFMELVEIMGKTDILIGPHAEDLAHMIFLRKEAVVIEAMPFGYAAGLHEELAKKLGLRFARAVGKADKEAFQNCLRQKKNEDVLKGEDVKRLQREFDRAISTGATEMVLEGPTMTEMRNCLIAQSVELHPPSVAEIVMNLGTRGCAKVKTAAR